MKVILNSDVANLGEEGDICSVAPGYARNFLLPKGLVLEYNERNAALIEGRRADIEARKAEKRREASSVKERIEAEPMKVSMTAGTNGKLFGSVSTSTIVEYLAAKGIEIERKKIDVPEKTIKTVGNFKVRIKLYGDEEATLLVSVTASNAREIEKEKEKLAEAEDSETNAAVEDRPTADALEGEAVAEEETLDPEVMAMRAAAEESADDDDATEKNAVEEDRSSDESDE